MTAFLAQRHWLGERSYVTVTGKPQSGQPMPLPKGLEIGLLVFCGLWCAFTLGYNILRDNNYLRTRDRYFDFVTRSYRTTGNNLTYPYQFISDRSEGKLYFANYDPIGKNWGPLEPFTTDMAFYQVTGLLMNENEAFQQPGKGLPSQPLSSANKIPI
jgi:hypothetical protein